MNASRLLKSLLCLFLVVANTVPADSDELPGEAQEFLEANCFDCHQGQDSEAGLDLEQLSKQYSESNAEQWVRIHDRVRDHEMPPSDYGDLDSATRTQFIESTSTWLQAAQTREHRDVGRVRGKRLTNLQLERTLHDLLGIDIPLATRMTEEPRIHGFNTVATGQPMSHFQLEQHLDVVDVALAEAFRRGTAKRGDTWSKTFSAKQVARRRQRRRCREPEMLDGNAVTWSAGLVFYGRLPVTTARNDGWYRLTVRAKALNPPKSGTVWCTVRTGKCISTAPLMGWAGAFEAGESFTESSVVAWLPRGHMFEIRPGDSQLKKAQFRGGQVGAGEGGPQNVPGVAIESLTIERIHQSASNAQIRRTLFGDLELEHSNGAARLVSSDPRSDAARLMKQFATRAFRRPVDDATMKPYLEIVEQSLDDERPLHESLNSGYRAVVCSPRFLYLTEKPGPLDNFAIASRLSYFLWNRMPDQRLMKLASDGKLVNRSVLRKQTERMLNDDRANSFIKDLSAQWLDLSLIDFTEPDRKLYPGFDPIVQNSMLDETHTFLQTMLDKDHSIGMLIDSDFTFLNSRLARYYGIQGVKGDALRKVDLQPKHHRGGLLTQGAILKVTANGTTTSPVIRGVWMSERLLGLTIPPPPANVPAIEPDIRGAKTIREQLEKHKQDPSCASCHVKMDPPGFALENYDPSGRWRNKYTKLKGRRRVPGPSVDASSELPDGQAFQNIRGFQALLLEDQPTIARNVVEKLITYGTGAPVAFADRPEVDACVDNAQSSHYGFRSLIHAVVQSDLFLSK